MDTTTFFVTNDDLKSYIHNIHNYLRNNGVGYGMTALNIFSLFYGLKLIQPKLKTLGLSKEEEELLDFNILVQKSLDTRNTNEISEYIDFKVLEKLYEMKSLNLSNGIKPNPNMDLAEFLFHQIPFDVYDGVWKELILKIDKLPIGYDATKKVNLSGKVYEYFIGRDKTAISELGAFFTDRHIVEFIYDKIKPTLNDDGNIKTMIDPFGGSGGFTLGYAYHLCNKYPNIKWENNVNKIYHFDMQKDVVNMTGIEMFAITGTMPEKNGNYERTNSFKHEFINRKFSYVVSNPPYGGDEYTKSIEEQKKECVIEHLKNDLKNMKNTDKFYKVRKDQILKLTSEINECKKMQENQMVNLLTCSSRIKAFATKHNIKVANDKEACSLILLVDLLEKDGTAGLVLKEGVFFDSKYTNLREVITKNFNITNIISVPFDAFENTKTKTSIIIVSNNGPTTNIVFSEIVIDIEQNNIFATLENGWKSIEKLKGEICNVSEKLLCSATFDMIGKSKEQNGKIKKEKYEWSWNYKNYKEHATYCPPNYKLYKLGDICLINTENPIIKSKIVNYVEIGDIDDNQINIKTDINIENIPKGTKRHPTFGDILICSVRPNVKKIVLINKHNYLDNMLVSGAIIIIKPCIPIHSIYLYHYIIRYLDDFLKTMGNGSTYPRISPDTLKSLQIPLPMNQHMNDSLTQLSSLKNSQEHETQYGKLTPEAKQIYDEQLNKLFEPFTQLQNPPQTTPTLLSAICSMTIGQSNKDTNKKKTKIYNLPHYEHYGLVYAKTTSFSGKYILGTRTGENKGEFVPVDGDFGASSNMIIIGMLEGYEQHYDKVLEKLQTDFDFKKLIEYEPVIIKGVKTELIGLKHIKSLSICL